MINLRTIMSSTGRSLGYNEERIQRTGRDGAINNTRDFSQTRETRSCENNEWYQNALRISDKNQSLKISLKRMNLGKNAASAPLCTTPVMLHQFLPAVFFDYRSYVAILYVSTFICSRGAK
ncbi:unnamed protein product [Amoebophrya sp. A25]|nr:unnamed protein product [Amoebophrya sp. A25]|eukprot:GSA25T00000500001.1